MRIDNQVIHRQIVKPALHLVSDPQFTGTNEEMRMAYEHYRKGNNKNAILEAAKAFESVIKTICTIKGYTVDSNSPVKALIKTLKENQYFPSYLEYHMDGILKTLESGLPTVRNKIAGHGQGQQVIDVPDAYVDYALNLVATNIVFLVKLL